jgi:hypothetical protein
MRSRIKTCEVSITAELADAISSFNIDDIANLLSDEGKFAVQNENYKIVISDKNGFISWLSDCYSKYSFNAKLRKKLSFNIVQCMHCVSGNPIIVFEEGRFPVFSGTQTKNEKSGLVIKYDENTITGIELCFLVMKTENPFIYERRCLRPDYE